VRGRKPQPHALKVLRGSRKVGQAGPVLPVATVTPPADLEGAALAIWNEAVPELVEARLLATVDVGRVARACRWEALGRTLLTEAEQVAGKERAELVRLAATCHGLADRTWVGLGVGDPRERNRMRPALPEEDRLAAFRAQHA
jgi:hypothetical protein